MEEHWREGKEAWGEENPEQSEEEWVVKAVPWTKVTEHMKQDLPQAGSKGRLPPPHHVVSWDWEGESKGKKHVPCHVVNGGWKVGSESKKEWAERESVTKTGSKKEKAVAGGGEKSAHTSLLLDGKAARASAATERPLRG